MAQSHEFSLTIPEGTTMILAQIARERIKQNQRWGQQNHPPVGYRADVVSYDEQAETYKRINDLDARQGRSNWAAILLEEVFEAFAEKDPAKIREELVQVGAVAVAAIDSLDRNELSS